MFVTRNVVGVSAWVLPKMKKRMERIAQKDSRWSMSRQLNEAIENGVSIDQLEVRVGIKPRP